MTQGMSPLRERLESLKQKLRTTGQNEAAQRGTQLEVDVANFESAIEVSEALIGLNDSADRAVAVLGSLTAAINKATAQAEVSSREATSVAKESATFSGQLNRLTRWVIIAAVLSAIAAAIQAGVALWGILR